jgi:hypothetical protein
MRGRFLGEQQGPVDGDDGRASVARTQRDVFASREIRLRLGLGSAELRRTNCKKRLKSNSSASSKVSFSSSLVAQVFREGDESSDGKRRNPL